MTERYWTPRTAEISNAMSDIRGNEPELWSRALRAVGARDPEALCAVLRMTDELDNSVDIRFSVAVQAMSQKAFDCAYAAWDDGGRCWCTEATSDKIPDSNTSANVMRSTCDLLIPGSSKLTADQEARLCEIMGRHTVQM